jgi:hypothetical protein
MSLFPKSQAPRHSLGRHVSRVDSSDHSVELPLVEGDVEQSVGGFGGVTPTRVFGRQYPSDLSELVPLRNPLQDDVSDENSRVTTNYGQRDSFAFVFHALS